MTYAGRTSLIREDARQDLRLRSGPITRLMEHYQHTHNLQSREAPRVRYKLARCSEADLHAFFIPRIGTTEEINHMETFSINRFAPNGNGKRQKKRRRLRPDGRAARGVSKRKGALKDADQNGKPRNTAPLDSLDARNFRNRRTSHQINSDLQKKRVLEFWNSPYAPHIPNDRNWYIPELTKRVRLISMIGAIAPFLHSIWRKEVQVLSGSAWIGSGRRQTAPSFSCKPPNRSNHPPEERSYSGR